MISITGLTHLGSEDSKLSSIGQVHERLKPTNVTSTFKRKDKKNMAYNYHSRTKKNFISTLELKNSEFFWRKIEKRSSLCLNQDQENAVIMLIIRVLCRIFFPLIMQLDYIW